jgi:hypothetical protein
MPSYQLYHMDPYTGHIDRAEELHAADDVSAVHGLQQSLEDHPRELWRAGRKVARLDAPPPWRSGKPAPLNLPP